MWVWMTIIDPAAWRDTRPTLRSCELYINDYVRHFNRAAKQFAASHKMEMCMAFQMETAGDLADLDRTSRIRDRLPTFWARRSKTKNISARRTCQRAVGHPCTDYFRVFSSGVLFSLTTVEVSLESSKAEFQTWVPGVHNPMTFLFTFHGTALNNKTELMILERQVTAQTLRPISEAFYVPLQLSEDYICIVSCI